jgi:hypothetical protein
VSTSPPATEPGPLARIWRACKIACVTLFVVWHLFFLVYRGIVDLQLKLDVDTITWFHVRFPWLVPKPVEAADGTRQGEDDAERAGDQKPRKATLLDRIDRATWFYGNWFGIEQGWALFSGPVSREASFLAARIDFTDGSDAWVYSENEPDLPHFVHLGGWRQRKYEDYLCYDHSENVAEDSELPLWSSYARWCLRRWRDANPDDRRRARLIVLVKRTIVFPRPDADPCVYPEPHSEEIAVFDPQGRLRP